MSDGKVVVTGICNQYLLMASSGDKTASELQDRVIRKDDRDGQLRFDCVNHALPGLEIRKRYWADNNGLRREITFVNNSKEKRYILPSTESRFAPEFKQDSYYFGAGYLGPYQPAPIVSEMTRVEQYKQTSKGMVLINAETGKGSFAHYRVKINDIVVLPWWQSTIGRYREMEDRLYYLPDGWRMALGCLDLEPDGGQIRYTDQLIFFPGTLYGFFEDVLSHDNDFSRALAAIPPSPVQIQDIFCIPQWGHEPYLKYITEMNEEGFILFRSFLSADWADYRWGNGFTSSGGGFITAEEVRDYVQNMHSISPRIMMGVYAITVATDRFSKIYAERPEWFRKYSRSGDEDSLFPGVFTNYQSMINIPECRNFLADSLFDMSDIIGSPYVYLDEAQQQNTINWQSGELIRDDHSIMLWSRMKKNAVKRQKILFFNGSGNPYADINYMEATNRQLDPRNWREFAGIALGLELFSKLRPDGRIALLYWNSATDYISRCLALGWIPVPNDGAPIPMMRAVYETGKTLPIDAQYTPDWKKDPETPVESYAVRRRNSKDVLLSFLNRSGKTTDIPVELRLETLGFAEDVRINIWAMATPCKGNRQYLLSDAESRANYKDFGWSERTTSTPELIYSGKAAKKLKHVFNDVAADELIQLVITPSPLAIYSLDNLVQNYFYTRRPGIYLNGKNVVSERADAELLLADKERIFTDVTINGKPVSIGQTDIGGILFQTVRIPSGTHLLEWKSEKRTPVAAQNFVAIFSNRRIEVDGAVPGTLFAVERHGRTLFTGLAPIILPEQFETGYYTVRLAGCSRNGKPVGLHGGGKTHVVWEEYPVIPEQVDIQKIDQHVKGLHVTRAATFLSRHRLLRRLQTDIAPCKVRVSVSELTLHAGTTRRAEGVDIDHYAGLEFSGAETLRLRLANSFAKAYSVGGDNVHFPSRSPLRNFSGLVVDYRENGKYVKRIAFSLGLGGEELKNVLPVWGKNDVQDVHISLGYLLSEPERVFSLDLRKYAPANWDGTVFFSIGNNHILPNRTLDVEILEINRRDTDDFIYGMEFGSSTKVVKKIPSLLPMPRLKTPPRSLENIEPQEWAHWAKIPSLLPYPGDNALREQTSACLAYDAENLYIAVMAEEKSRTLKASQAMPWNNDCVEFYFQTGDGNIIQVVVDAAGRKISFPPQVMDDIAVRVSQEENRYYCVFLAVPWQTLKIKDIYAGIRLRFNLCRTRLDPGAEKSAWGPVRQAFGFRDVENFGTIMAGNIVEGMGRYEEFPAE